MMRSEKLQIGDWVKYTRIPYIQVSNITKRKIGYHVKKNETRMYYVRYCEISGIPITSELLERNKFDCLWEQHSYRWKYSTPSFYECIEFEYISDGMWLVMCKGRYGTARLSISYLHQLQQICRLCDINKTIEP